MLLENCQAIIKLIRLCQARLPAGCLEGKYMKRGYQLRTHLVCRGHMDTSLSQAYAICSGLFMLSPRFNRKKL